jgi:cytochrome c oxidase subunit I
MAIETHPEKAQHPGGGEPARPQRARPWWLRPAIHTAFIGAVAGYLLGHWLGNVIASGYQQVTEGDLNDLAIVLGYAFATVGWLAGLGVFNDLLVRMTGREVLPGEHADAQPGLARYFRYSLDHKVVGVQYLVGMIIYFCTAGLFAMAIRAELLSPTYHLFNAGTYIELVGEHGTMMMMLMTSVILGPFGNYFVPIMIGSKRVAFPGSRRCRSGSPRARSSSCCPGC